MGCMERPRWPARRSWTGIARVAIAHRETLWAEDARSAPFAGLRGPAIALGGLGAAMRCPTATLAVGRLGLVLGPVVIIGVCPTVCLPCGKSWEICRDSISGMWSPHDPNQ